MAWRDREGWKVLQRVDGIFMADPRERRYDEELGQAALRLGETGDEKLILWVRTLCQRFHDCLADSPRPGTESYLLAHRGLALLGARSEALRGLKRLVARSREHAPLLEEAAEWEERVPSREAFLGEIGTVLVGSFPPPRAEAALARWVQVERGGLSGNFPGKSALLSETVQALEARFGKEARPRLRRLEGWCLPLPVTVPGTFRYRPLPVTARETSELLRRVAGS